MLDSYFDLLMLSASFKHPGTQAPKPTPAVRSGNQEQQMTDAMIDDLFSYHAPKAGQPERYENVRSAAREFAKVLIANTPPSADQSAAIRELRVCVMTANASIALEK